MNTTQDNWHRIEIVFRDPDHLNHAITVLNTTVGRGRENWHLNKGGTIASAKFRPTKRTVKVRIDFEHVASLSTQLALI